MTLRFVAVAAALVIGVSAPVSPARAFSYEAPVDRFAPPSPSDDLTTGSVGIGGDGTPRTGGCVPSSASEGDANRQTRPVRQYGQTSGGSRC
jgi:hypothetical protein